MQDLFVGIAVDVTCEQILIVGFSKNYKKALDFPKPPKLFIEFLILMQKTSLKKFIISSENVK
jgi:hypothetical protein